MHSSRASDVGFGRARQDAPSGRRGHGGPRRRQHRGRSCRDGLAPEARSGQCTSSASPVAVLAARPHLPRREDPERPRAGRSFIAPEHGRGGSDASEASEGAEARGGAGEEPPFSPARRRPIWFGGAVGRCRATALSFLSRDQPIDDPEHGLSSRRRQALDLLEPSPKPKVAGRTRVPVFWRLETGEFVERDAKGASDLGQHVRRRPAALVVRDHAFGDPDQPSSSWVKPWPCGLNDPLADGVSNWLAFLPWNNCGRTVGPTGPLVICLDMVTYHVPTRSMSAKTHEKIRAFGIDTFSESSEPQPAGPSATHIWRRALIAAACSGRSPPRSLVNIDSISSPSWPPASAHGRRRLKTDALHDDRAPSLS